MTEYANPEIEDGILTAAVDIDPTKLELSEEVIQLNRVAKVVKGGRNFSFSALVVVGDKKGHVGVGLGKANEVTDSIAKGVQDAKKNLIKIPLVHGTIPYEVMGEYSAARVMLKPASEGTGIIAGPAVRSLLELGGIQDVLTKSLGSKNLINILKAVIQGLDSIRDAEEVVRLRGKNLEEVVGRKRAKMLVGSRRAALAASDAENKGEKQDEKKNEAKKEAKPADVVVVNEEDKSGESKAEEDAESLSKPVELPPEVAAVQEVKAEEKAEGQTEETAEEKPQESASEEKPEA